jgi:HEPN domain-containing protein
MWSASPTAWAPWSGQPCGREDCCIPDQNARDLHLQWLDRATEDLEAARRLTDLPQVCSFHCQQAVEKGIKALLMRCGAEFPRTHDIDILLRRLGDYGQMPVTVDPEDLATLTRFAVGTRYPPDRPTPQEAEAALALAERFLHWAVAQVAGSEGKSGQPTTPV